MKLSYSQSSHVMAHRSTPAVVCNSLSGRGRGRGSPDFGSGDSLLLGGRGQPQRNPQKLVLPGGGTRQGPPGGGRLIIPEKGMEKMLAEGAEKLGPEVVTMTGPNRYRPPAGFMNDNVTEDSTVSNMAPDEMINKLRARAGKWHQLAKLLPPLIQAGYDSNSIDESTGITPALQNRWSVAATVYDSLVSSGKLQEEMLARFDTKGEDLLYPFRFLNQEMRLEAAKYIITKDLDGPACEVLARAMKEWERRPAERHGFTNLPGDCMAFKYLRDALECRKLEAAEVKMQQAIDAAVTDDALARLVEAQSKLRGSDAKATEKAGQTGLASLTILRLDPDELGFRPIPLLGALGEVSETVLEAAPRTSQEGAFGAFTIEGVGLSSKWVALPQWKALAMMRHPVAVSLVDCALVPAIVMGTKAKTDDDKKRLSGPGLLVADKCRTSSDDVDVATYYLAAGQEDGAKLALLEGSQVKARGLTAVATIVFVARPPIREQPVTTSESMIQL